MQKQSESCTILALDFEGRAKVKMYINTPTDTGKLRPETCNITNALCNGYSTNQTINRMSELNLSDFGKKNRFDAFTPQ